MYAQALGFSEGLRLWLGSNLASDRAAGGLTWTFQLDGARHLYEDYKATGAPLASPPEELLVQCLAQPDCVKKGVPARLLAVISAPTLKRCYSCLMCRADSPQSSGTCWAVRRVASPSTSCGQQIRTGALLCCTPMMFTCMACYCSSTKAAACCANTIKHASSKLFGAAMRRWSQAMQDTLRHAEHKATSGGADAGTLVPHTLPDAGHWLHVDNPDGLLQLVSGGCCDAAEARRQ